MTDTLFRSIDLTDEAGIPTYDPSDSWQDYVDWKRLRSQGYEAAIVKGHAFLFGKYGIGDEIPLTSTDASSSEGTPR